MRRYFSEKAESYFYVGETDWGVFDGLPVFTKEEATDIAKWQPSPQDLKKLFSFKLALGLPRKNQAPQGKEKPKAEFQGTLLFK